MNLQENKSSVYDFKDDRALVFHMDFCKSIETPNGTSNLFYFSRKVKSRLFGIYVANLEKVFLFVWPENVSGKGPDEVNSCVYWLMTKILKSTSQFLIIWSDNCPSEFKNNKMFYFCDWMVRTERLTRIDLKFLVAGHTYGMVDRKSGQLEGVIERAEAVSTLHDWISIVCESFPKNILEVIEMKSHMFLDWTEYFSSFYIKRFSGTLKGENTQYLFSEICWANFGIGERIKNVIENLDDKVYCWSHIGKTWLRKSFSPIEEPVVVDLKKKRQCFIPSNREPTVKYSETGGVDSELKKSCVHLSERFFGESAVKYYSSMPEIVSEEKSCRDSEYDAS